MPATMPALVRQRLRWDRDALAIRLMAYRQFLPFRRGEPLGSTLERIDFLIFDLMASLVFPYYLLHVAATFGAGFSAVMLGAFVALFWVTMFNLLLAHLALRRIPRLMELAVMPLFPVYQAFAMRFLRFAAFSDEILFAGSRHDRFVPDRVRRALYGKDAV